MKTFLLISVPFVLTALAVIYFRLCRRPREPLVIRHRDRAIFERDADGFLHRVEYQPRRWWQIRGRFVWTCTEKWWYPASDTEYDEVARDYVLEGLNISGGVIQPAPELNAMSFKIKDPRV